MDVLSETEDPFENEEATERFAARYSVPDSMEIEGTRSGEVRADNMKDLNDSLHLGPDGVAMWIETLLKKHEAAFLEPSDTGKDVGDTTVELLAAFAKECPNGVSFDPMAVRLLRQKVLFKDCQIENLKAAMFQLNNRFWFTREMISDNDSFRAFIIQVTKWLTEYHCFSVDRLFNDFFITHRHISNVEDCATFLRHFGFLVAVWGKGGHFCFLPPPSLHNILATISESISGWLEETNGTLSFLEIEQAMPHLTVEALDSIRVQFLPEVHAMEIGGVPCWCSTEAIHLPENFSEILTSAVDTLVALEDKVSVANLEFALNLLYRVRFRKEYALPNNSIFLRVCAKHYQGVNRVFPNTNKSSVRADDLSVPRKRVRSPNTRFHNLVVPIGAELVFTKNSHITCTVLDDTNQVKYNGKAWTISSLANHLLSMGATSVNGFEHFSYDGETLWNRRVRLERSDNHENFQVKEMPPPDEVKESKGGIIGLEAQPLRDNDTLVHVCAKQYQGENDVFPNSKKSSVSAIDLSAQDMRARSQNTCFRILGVPVGAKLVFTKDNHFTCTVLDDSNQVEYDGKAWSISALATHLLGWAISTSATHLTGVSPANGFAHFSYENEILWDRRLRLERAEKQDDYQAKKIPPPAEIQAVKGEIIDLEGRPLSPTTWSSLRRDGTNPRVAEWAQRVQKGEKVKHVAREWMYPVSTMKVMISNYHLYLKICEFNSIEPESGANV